MNEKSCLYFLDQYFSTFRRATKIQLKLFDFCFVTGRKSKRKILLTISENQDNV